MWTSDHHNHIWFFPKLLPQKNTELYRMSLYTVDLQFPFCGFKEGSTNHGWTNLDI